MTLTSFAIARLNRDALIALAFVCPDLKYAAMLVKGLEGIARRAADDATWRDVAHELAVGVPPRESLPSTSAIVQLLVREPFRADVSVQYLHHEDVPNGPRTLRTPGADQRWLDTRLHQCQPWTSMDNQPVPR